LEYAVHSEMHPPDSIQEDAKTIPPLRRNRMLLLQDTMAKKLNAELDEIEVGVYDFVAGQHYATKFKPSQIRAVQKKMFALLSEFGK
jgi:hypothetical protein